MTPSQSQNWIEDFTRLNGRPPRILHFGNICNNAYQIAKMQNDAGADCDVLSVDYYHFMGAPEWDEADFTGDIGSQFYPAWHKVDLHGYVRPRWFALGTQKTASAYLCARRRGQTAKADRLWRKLDRHARYLSFKEGSALKPLLSLFEKLADAAGMAWRYLRVSPALLAIKLKRLRGCALTNEELATMRRLEGTAGIIARVQADTALFPQLAFDWNDRLDDFAADAVKYQELFSLYDLIHAYSTEPVWPYLAGVAPYVAYENGTLRYLPNDPDVPGRLLLLAYANAGAVMVTNTDCYDNALYMAKPTGTPVVHALHGIDVTRMIEKCEMARTQTGFDGRLGIARDVPLFYCPSRHTWDEGLGVFLKGEDQAVRAAARLAGRGYRFKLVLARWGSDIDRMERLVADIPALADIVEWRQPVDKANLLKVFTSVDAVLDQFYWPVFGAITFETLCAAHAPLISKWVEPGRMVDFFGAAVPYCACRDEDDVYGAMKAVLDDPNANQNLVAQGRAWMETRHSPACILQRCWQAYKEAL